VRHDFTLNADGGRRGRFSALKMLPVTAQARRLWSASCKDFFGVGIWTGVGGLGFQPVEPMATFPDYLTKTLPRQALQGFQVLGAGIGQHLGRQGRRRRLFVPAQ
jgi:hypothetical protein